MTPHCTISNMGVRWLRCSVSHDDTLLKVPCVYIGQRKINGKKKERVSDGGGTSGKFKNPTQPRSDNSYSGCGFMLLLQNAPVGAEGCHDLSSVRFDDPRQEGDTTRNGLLAQETKDTKHCQPSIVDLRQ